MAAGPASIVNHEREDKKKKTKKKNKKKRQLVIIIFLFLAIPSWESATPFVNSTDNLYHLQSAQ